jgi:hypothetical protein
VACICWLEPRDAVKVVWVTGVFMNDCCHDGAGTVGLMRDDGLAIWWLTFGAEEWIDASEIDERFLDSSKWCFGVAIVGAKPCSRRVEMLRM